MKKFFKGVCLVGALSLAVLGATKLGGGNTEVAAHADPIYPPIGTIELAFKADPIMPPIGSIKFTSQDVKIFGDTTTACWWCIYTGRPGTRG